MTAHLLDQIGRRVELAAVTAPATYLALLCLLALVVLPSTGVANSPASETSPMEGSSRIGTSHQSTQKCFWSRSFAEPTQVLGLSWSKRCGGWEIATLDLMDSDVPLLLRAAAGPFVVADSSVGPVAIPRGQVLVGQRVPTSGPLCDAPTRRCLKPTWRGHAVEGARLLAGAPSQGSFDADFARRYARVLERSTRVRIEELEYLGEDNWWCEVSIVDGDLEEGVLLYSDIAIAEGRPDMRRDPEETSDCPDEVQFVEVTCDTSFFVQRTQAHITLPRGTWVGFSPEVLTEDRYFYLGESGRVEDSNCLGGEKSVLKGVQRLTWELALDRATGNTRAALPAYQIINQLPDLHSVSGFARLGGKRSIVRAGASKVEQFQSGVCLDDVLVRWDSDKNLESLLSSVTKRFQETPEGAAGDRIKEHEQTHGKSTLDSICSCSRSATDELEKPSDGSERLEAEARWLAQAGNGNSSPLLQAAILAISVGDLSAASASVLSCFEGKGAACSPALTCLLLGHLLRSRGLVRLSRSAYLLGIGKADTAVHRSVLVHHYREVSRVVKEYSPLAREKLGPLCSQDEREEQDVEACYMLGLEMVELAIVELSEGTGDEGQGVPRSTGLLESGMELLARVSATSPDYPGALLYQAKGWAALGKHSKGLELVLQAIQEACQRSPVRDAVLDDLVYHAAVFLHETGDPRNAIELADWLLSRGALSDARQAVLIARLAEEGGTGWSRKWSQFRQRGDHSSSIDFGLLYAQTLDASNSCDWVAVSRLEKMGQEWIAALSSFVGRLNALLDSDELEVIDGPTLPHKLIELSELVASELEIRLQAFWNLVPALRQGGPCDRHDRFRAEWDRYHSLVVDAGLVPDGTFDTYEISHIVEQELAVLWNICLQSSRSEVRRIGAMSGQFEMAWRELEVDINAARKRGLAMSAELQSLLRSMPSMRRSILQSVLEYEGFQDLSIRLGEIVWSEREQRAIERLVLPTTAGLVEDATGSKIGPKKETKQPSLLLELRQSARPVARERLDHLCSLSRQGTEIWLLNAYVYLYPVMSWLQPDDIADSCYDELPSAVQTLLQASLVQLGASMCISADGGALLRQAALVERVLAAIPNL